VPWEIVVRNFLVGQLALANCLFLRAGVQGSEYYFLNFLHFLQPPYFDLYANFALCANLHLCRMASNAPDSIACSRSTMCGRDRCEHENEEHGVLQMTGDVGLKGVGLGSAELVWRRGARIVEDADGCGGGSGKDKAK